MKLACGRAALLLSVALSACSSSSQAPATQGSPAAGASTAEQTSSAPPSEGRISGLVFEDRNRNGTFDPDEAGKAGASITLGQPDGSQILSSATTAADGRFQFDKAAPGQYRVTLRMPAGFERTRDDSFILTMKPDGTATEVHFGIALTKR